MITLGLLAFLSERSFMIVSIFFFFFVIFSEVKTQFNMPVLNSISGSAREFLFAPSLTFF